MVRVKGTLPNTILHGKVEIMRKASKTVVGRCKKGWTGLSLNETLGDPVERAAWRKLVSRVAPKELNSLRSRNLTVCSFSLRTQIHLNTLERCKTSVVHMDHSENDEIKQKRMPTYTNYFGLLCYRIAASRDHQIVTIQRVAHGKTTREANTNKDNNITSHHNTISNSRIEHIILYPLQTDSRMQRPIR